MPESSRLRRSFDHLLSFGAYEGESTDQRGRRRILVGALWLSLLPIVVSSLPQPGKWLVITGLTQGAIHSLALLAIRWAPLRFALIVNVMIAFDVTTDVIDSFLLGGLYSSGLAVLWSLIGVLGALVALSIRAAVFWFVIFVAEVVLVVAVSPIADPVYEVADPLIEGAVSIIGMTILVFAVMAYFVRQRDRFQRQSDELLHNVLPDQIADRLIEGSGMIADQFDGVSVLFADVVDFTPMSAAMSPTELVGLLNEVFSDIDGFVEELGLEKIKTIGDEYMVASGVPTPRPDHAHAVAELALRIRDHVSTKSFAGQRIAFRIGINSGPVVAGIIGRRKFAYDLWGDVVNTASRMESQGAAGQIQISQATFALIADSYDCEFRGSIEIKGKGEQETWFLVAKSRSGLAELAE